MQTMMKSLFSVASINSVGFNYILSNNEAIGREPWSSGYGKRLMFRTSWVRFLALYTGWTIFHVYLMYNCNVCLKRPKLNKKEARIGPLKKLIKAIS